MTRQKVTVTLDRDKAETAQKLTGVVSLSEVIDQAINRLITQERTRNDVAVYLREQSNEDEMAMGEAAVGGSLVDEDVDWEALYADVES